MPAEDFGKCSTPYLKLTRSRNTDTSATKMASHIAKNLNLNNDNKKNKILKDKRLLLHAKILGQTAKANCK
jgi:hypothetical protein